jgi:hypothetical protein
VRWDGVADEHALLDIPVCGKYFPSSLMVGEYFPPQMAGNAMCHFFLNFRRVFLKSILEEAFNIDDIPRIIFVKKYQFRKGGHARK